MKILLLMILMHIIDDFVFQPQSLSYLKQKSWWEKNYPQEKYEDDYRVALFLHALSWSIMVHVPLMFTMIIPSLWLTVSVLANLGIHMWVDDLKANKGKLSLFQDQMIHMIQVSLTWALFSIL